MSHAAALPRLSSRITAMLRGVRGDGSPLASVTGDQLAIALSGLCLVHCLISTVALASIASVGSLLLSPVIHEVGLVLAIGFALITLIVGVITHGYMMPFAVGCFGLGIMAGALAAAHDGTEVLATMIGVAVVALGHDLNRRATH